MGRRRKLAQLASDTEKISFRRDFTPPPTIERFMLSDAFMRCVMGPFGSGKSTACCFEIFRRAQEQAKAKDGFRYTRWAVVRNTYPELKTTTLNTWRYWFPPGVFGNLSMGTPIIFNLEVGDIRSEIIFLALDKEGDEDKLLSFELTGVWVNEARQIPKTIIDALIGRVSTGRYPAMADGGPTWAGIIMDTNPPDEDSWIPQMFGDAPPDIMEDLAGADDFLLEGESLEIDPENFKLFKQPSGLAPDAENLGNLKGGREYYLLLAQGKRPEYVNVYVHGRYGSSLDGKPVFSEFQADKHIAQEPLKPNPKLPIFLGWDFGRTPACLVAQISPRGNLRVLKEITSSGMGIETFVKTLAKWHLSEYHGYEFISTGDPSGKFPGQQTEKTCLDILRDNGIPTQPAWTNDVFPRLEAVRYYLEHFPDGNPGMLIDPSCKTLIYGFKRGYRWKRIKVQGEERWTDKIDKVGNMYTDIQDALQYLCMRVQRKFRSAKTRVQRKRYEPADRVAGY